MALQTFPLPRAKAPPEGCPVPARTKPTCRPAREHDRCPVAGALCPVPVRTKITRQTAREHARRPMLGWTRVIRWPPIV